MASGGRWTAGMLTKHRLVLAALLVGYLLGSMQTGLRTLPSFIGDASIKITGTTQGDRKFQAVSSQYGPITRIALIGERNTGTTWIYDELKTCFGNQVDITRGLTRYKHWFQTDRSTLPRSNTIVLAMFRDPYDWIAAMKRRPHHAPNHLHFGDNYIGFMDTPWTMDRPENETQYENITGPICQEGFHYNQIIPCLRPEFKSRNETEHIHSFSGWDPQYELRQDGSGLPFNNIFELRAAKIRNHLSIRHWDWISHLEVIQYEDMLRNGTGPLLRLLERLLDHSRNGSSRDGQMVIANCSDIPPAPERLNKYKHRPKFLSGVDERSNWETESMIGYFQR